MIFTKEIWIRGKSSNGGYNKYQLECLGLKHPLKTGLFKELIGKDFDEKIINRFLELKDSHLKRIGENGEYIKVKSKVKTFVFTPVNNNLTYKEQYLHPNWQKVRLEVLKRDNYSCVNCKAKEKTLHAHHLKYQKNKYIWEVPIWYIVTLCEDCHSEEHNRDLTIKR